MRITLALPFILLILISCSRPAPATTNREDTSPHSGPSLTDGAAMKAHIQKLASDDMEGRAPGGKGEELATAYIADFYKRSEEHTSELQSLTNLVCRLLLEKKKKKKKTIKK